MFRGVVGSLKECLEMEGYQCMRILCLYAVRLHIKI